MNGSTTLKIGRILKYFSLRELLIIIFLATMAVVSGTFAPKTLHLGDGGVVPTIIHGILKLPGPGTGLMIFGGALCFCLVLGLLLIKKPWTAVTIALLTIVIDLIFGQEIVSAIPKTIHSLDVILFVAIIIELLSLISWDKPHFRYIVPIILTILGMSTLFFYYSGQTRIGYVILAIIALCYAIISYCYPLKYLNSCGIANMYYILHFWVFCGDSLLARIPTSLDLIMVILCAGIVGGVIFASAAYGVNLLVKSYIDYDSGEIETS